jgi:hypothetical protein
MLRKVLFYLMKENHGLHEDDVIAEPMIPTTFNEETELLSDNNYMICYWKVRKDFLDYIEGSMPHDSFIGSTISTRSKIKVCCHSKISSSSVILYHTNISKLSEKDKLHDI